MNSYRKFCFVVTALILCFCCSNLSAQTILDGFKADQTVETPAAQVPDQPANVQNGNAEIDNQQMMRFFQMMGNPFFIMNMMFRSMMGMFPMPIMMPPMIGLQPGGNVGVPQNMNFPPMFGPMGASFTQNINFPPMFGPMGGANRNNQLGNPNDPPPEDSDEVKKLKAEIKEKYGVDAVNDGGQIAAGWTIDQLRVLEGVFEDLPENFRSMTKKVVRQSVKVDQGRILTGVSGEVFPDIPDTVFIFNNGVTSKPTADANAYFRATLIHEMGHTFHAQNDQIFSEWKNRFWGGGDQKSTSPSVSDYGESMPEEDFAESVSEYVCNGRNMKTENPERYDFVRENVMNGREYDTTGPAARTLHGN